MERSRAERMEEAGVIFLHATSLHLRTKPELKQSKAGKTYAKGFGVVNLPDNGAGDDSHTGFPLGITCFGTAAEKLGKLKKGDTVSCNGTFQLYTKPDGTQSYSLLVDELLSVKRAPIKIELEDEE